MAGKVTRRKAGSGGAMCKTGGGLFHVDTSLEIYVYIDGRIDCIDVFKWIVGSVGDMWVACWQHAGNMLATCCRAEVNYAKMDVERVCFFD